MEDVIGRKAVFEAGKDEVVLDTQLGLGEAGRRWLNMELSLGPRREEARMIDIAVNRRTATKRIRRRREGARMSNEGARETPDNYCVCVA